MEETQDPIPAENEEVKKPSWFAVRRKMLLIVGGAVLLLVANFAAWVVLYQRMTPPPVTATPAVANVPAAPVAAPPSKEDLEKAARLAAELRRELGAAHQRILSEDSRGVIADLPQTRSRPASPPPVSSETAPATPASAKAGSAEKGAESPAADSWGVGAAPAASAPAKTGVTPAAKEPAKEAGKEAAPANAPSGLTPMGRLGQGVSKDNLDALTKAVEEMNRLPAKPPEKKR